MKEEKNRNNETLVNIEDKTVCYHPHSKGIYNVFCWNKPDFDITRDDIPVYSVDAAYMATPTVGYIKVSRFAATTPEEIGQAFR